MTFTPLSTDFPPTDIDVLFKLVDGSYAVGYKDVYGDIVPANVESTYDGAGDVIFSSQPHAWSFISDNR